MRKFEKYAAIRSANIGNITQLRICANVSNIRIFSQNGSFIMNSQVYAMRIFLIFATIHKANIRLKRNCKNILVPKIRKFLQNALYT